MIRTLWYALGRLLIAIAARILLKMDVHWKSPRPTGPVILAVNHPSTTDPFLVTTLLPERVSILIKGLVFKLPIVGQSLRFCGHIPVVAGSGKAALEDAERLLKAGRTIIIFPEGEISPAGGFHKARTGLARLALATGAPVIPVGISIDTNYLQNGKLNVPDCPVVPFIEGDGSGPDIWRGAQPVFDAAVEKAYGGKRKIAWKEVLAGKKAFDQTQNWLPNETLDAFRTYLVGIKGPLETPVGGGIRSLNVALRKELDLYVCLRPVRYFAGIPSPVKHPEKVDMVIFRENTEDLYSGIEFEQGTPDNTRFKELLKEHFPKEYAKIAFPNTSGIGLKPISEEGTKRLVRAAILYALENKRKSVTLIHKGNIMKYTEGAFRIWGYELAREEFGSQVYTWETWNKTKAAKGEEAANAEQDEAVAQGKLVVKDLIADNAFARFLAYPQEYDVVASPNLNGDYLSDFLAAQVGGLGIAPGGNINYVTGAAVFEATHGTAPRSAGLNRANPGSVLLSGEMMLRYMGWNEAADLIVKGIEGAIAARTVTRDLVMQMSETGEKATQLKTDEFGRAIIQHMA